MWNEKGEKKVIYGNGAWEIQKDPTFFFLFPLDKRNTNIFSSSLSSAVFCCLALVFRRRRRRRDIKDLIDLRHVLSSLSLSPRTGNCVHLHVFITILNHCSTDGKDWHITSCRPSLSRETKTWPVLLWGSRGEKKKKKKAKSLHRRALRTVPDN